MPKKIDDDQKRAEARAEKFLKMSEGARKLGELRGCLAFVRGLLSNGTSEKSRVIVVFDDGGEKPISLYASERDCWRKLVSEAITTSTPILGATETALRENIRKKELELREMGVTDV